MATDEGIRGVLLETLRPEIERRQDDLAKQREQKKLALLEDAAQATLGAGDNTLLADAGIVDKRAVTAIQAQIDKLQAEIDAIRNYRTAIKAVS